MNKKQRTKMNKDKKKNRVPIKREYTGVEINHKIKQISTLKKCKKKRITKKIINDQGRYRQGLGILTGIEFDNILSV